MNNWNTFRVHIHRYSNKNTILFSVWVIYLKSRTYIVIRSHCTKLKLNKYNNELNNDMNRIE